MTKVKKFNIIVSTGWCGMDAEFSAYAEKESDLDEFAQQLANDNFEMYGGSQLILENNFEPDENGDFTDEQRDEAEETEGDFYEYCITEVLEGSDAEDYFDEYELVFDARLIDLSYKEQIEIYNEFLISFHTAMWTGRDLQPFFKKMAAYSYARTNSCEGESDRDIEIDNIDTLINLTK